MKKIFLLLFVAVAVVACKKDNTSPASYFGTYELRANYGGLAGIYVKHQPGNGNILQLNNDSTFKRFVNGKLDREGRFHVRTVFQTANKLMYDHLLYDDETYSTEIRLHNDTLTLGTTITDNIATDLVRIK